MSKLMFAPITKTAEADDGSLTVEGYASADKADAEGDIITADAMRNALPDYMKFGAVREMHQLNAVGTALHAEVMNDGKTAFKAKIVDPMAIKKVKENVYKGFSIGANTLSREGNTITGIRLVEVSLVDTPTNPEAVITMYKAQEVDMSGDIGKARKSTDDEDLDKAARESAEKRAADEAKREDEMEKAREAEDEEKADKAKDGEYGSHKEAGYADPGYQDDGRPRYPLKNDGKLSKERIRAAWNYIHMAKNREKYTASEVKRIEGRIVRAWKEAIDPKGPPEAEEKTDKTEKTAAPDIQKGLQVVAAGAQVLQQLNTVWEITKKESQIEGDASKVPGMIEEAMKQFAEALVAMTDEETKEVLTGTDDKNQAYQQVMYYATRQPELAKAGRRHSKADLERMAKIVDILKEMGHSEDDEEVKAMRAKMADAEKADAEKADAQKTSDLSKTEVPELLKSMGAQLQGLIGKVDSLSAENAALKSELIKLGEQPAEAKGSLLTVNKTTDTGGTQQSDEDAIQLLETLAVRDREGQIQKTATAIKLLQRTGGQPLLTGVQRPEGRGDKE